MYQGVSSAMFDYRTVHKQSTYTHIIFKTLDRRNGQAYIWFSIAAQDMLNGGIRFIDFRMMYTQGPGRAIGEKDWYCLHGCESQRKATEYLKQIRSWSPVSEILIQGLGFDLGKRSTQELNTHQSSANNSARRSPSH